MKKQCKKGNRGQYLSGFVLNQQSNVPGVKGVPATLKDVGYDCQVLNNILMVEMKQVFKSSELDCFSESFYEVSIQDGGCFEHFEATFDGKNVIGVVKSKEDAKKEYSEEKSKGSLVSYAEVEQKNIFEQLVKIKLGNLPPNSEITIRIKFSHQVVSLLNSFYAVTIPLIFIEQTKQDVQKESNEQSLLTLQLNCTGSITFCESKGYPTEIVKIDSNTYKIALSAVYVEENTPFCLVYGYEGMYEPQTIFGVSKSRKPENAAKYQESPYRESVFVSFLPAFNTPAAHAPAGNEGSIEIEKSQENHNLKASILGCADIFNDEQLAQILDQEGIDHMDSSHSEFIFLLDRSGSMAGTPFTKAIQALTLFLQSLPNGSYFNVVGFGTTSKNLFPKSVLYNQDSLKQALKTLSTYKANLGGTEIFKPLERIFQSAKIEGNFNRQIFLLTDGEVTKPETVIELIKRNRQYSRVHAIGVGTSVDRKLIEESARIGRGQSIIIDLTADFSDAIVSLLSSSITPSLDDFQIAYDKSVIESAFPDVKNLPCVFNDEIFNLHLFVKQGVKIDEIAEESKIITISYYDSKLKRKVESVIRLQTADAFLCNESLRETTFKLGKQLELNQKIEELDYESEMEEKQEIAVKKEELIVESVDFQILNKLTAVICVVKKLNDAEASQFNETKHDVVFQANAEYLEQLKEQQLIDWEKNHPGHPFLQQHKQKSDPKIQMNRHAKVLSIPKRSAYQCFPQMSDDVSEIFETPQEETNQDRIQHRLKNKTQHQKQVQDMLSFDFEREMKYSLMCQYPVSFGSIPQLGQQSQMNLSQMYQSPVQLGSIPQLGQQGQMNYSQLNSSLLQSGTNSIGQKDQYYKNSDNTDSKEEPDDVDEIEQELSENVEGNEESYARSLAISRRRCYGSNTRIPTANNTQQRSKSRSPTSSQKKKCKRISSREDSPLKKKKQRLTQSTAQDVMQESKKSEEKVVLQPKIQLNQLLSHIESNGLCKYSEKVCLTYLSAKDLTQLQTQNAGLSKDVFMAGFVLAVLKEFFSKDKSKWNLIAKKALSWAKTNAADISVFNKLQEEILKRIQDHEKK